MIPIIINNDIPFPIPLSVIFSPNHIAKMVPVVRINTERSEEHTSELQSRPHLVCRLLLEKKNPRPPPRALRPAPVALVTQYVHPAPPRRSAPAPSPARRSPLTARPPLSPDDSTQSDPRTL